MKTLKASVIICTKDRPDDIRTALRSLAVQTSPPDEIVIVDAGRSASCEPGVGREFPALPIRHLPIARPGLTRQRNIGIRESTGDIVLFIDDDVILEPDYVEQVLDVFANDSGHAIGAVLARVTNFELPRYAILARAKGAVLAALLRLFLLPRAGSGRLQPSGLSTYPFRLETPRFVECLSGCAMSFRRELVQQLGFDEALSGYAEMEDVDVAVRLGRHARIAYHPAARLLHLRSPVARTDERSRQRDLILSYAYLTRKNWPLTVRRRAAFWWAVFGIFALHLSACRWESCRGTVVGIAMLIRKHVRGRVVDR